MLDMQLVSWLGDGVGDWDYRFWVVVDVELTVEMS